MSHHLYHTDAFVLESYDIGEANKYFYLFTREIGMITASAQAVRDAKSKLRANLRDFSRITVSLVRGKNSWKITNAIIEHNFYDLVKNGGKDQSMQIMQVTGHIFSLLKRLLHGEEKNERLFDVVASGLSFLQTLDGVDISNAECILVLNILNLLGYVGKQDDFKNLIIEPTPSSTGPTDPLWTKGLLAAAIPLREKALLEINRSLKESQL